MSNIQGKAKNLGLIAAMVPRSTPPINKKLLWYDTTGSGKNPIKYYNVLNGQWEEIASQSYIAGIDKIYPSVEAMNQDEAPVSDITDLPLKGGQMVIIVTEDESSEDSGKIFRFDNPGWTYLKTLGSGVDLFQTKVDEALETNDKTITGAINEVKELAEQGSAILPDNVVYSKDSTEVPSVVEPILGDILTKTEAVETYQPIIDEKLQTEDKTVVGAINEVNGIAKNAQPKEDGKGLSTNDYTDEDKQKVANAVLYTSQELTDEQKQQVQKNIAPGGYARPLYEAAGAVYNEETGFYELNGLTDITEEDMAAIYTYSIGTYNSNDLSFCFVNAPIRTNLISHFGKGRAGEYFSLSGAFASSKIEVAAITDESLTILVQTIANAFQNCRNLKKVIGILSLGSITSIGTATFTNCVELRNINLRNLKASITFPNSPNLSKDMILFMIKNSTATEAITITLHPTAFAMASSDEDIQQALSEKTFVSLAQA